MKQKIKISSVDGTKLGNEDFEMARSIVESNKVTDSVIYSGNVRIEVGNPKETKCQQN